MDALNYLTSTNYIYGIIALLNKLLNIIILTQLPFRITALFSFNSTRFPR